jgi:TonB family protein
MKGGFMYRRGLVLGAFAVLLVSCAQVPPKASNEGSQASEDTHQPRLNANNAAPLPATHPALQDIAYNSHYPPVFPQEAIRYRHHGTVVLMIHVDAQGRVGDIRVDQSSGYSELDATALVVAKQWRFIPAAQNGTPQSSWVSTPIHFNLAVSSSPANGPQSMTIEQKAQQAEQQGDYATAYALLRPIAEEGNVVAQYGIGLFYRNGTGVAQDDAQAVMWFRKAAEQGNADAENALGTMYLEGRGVAKDSSKAKMWLERSALTGSASGESNFGLLYLQGRVDGRPNYVVAYALMLASTNRMQGNPGYAQGTANDLSYLQQVMSQRQLDLGKKLAAQIDKYGIAVAMSSHWYGADYAATDPCMPDSNAAACDDEKYEAALKSMDR